MKGKPDLEGIFQVAPMKNPREIDITTPMQEGKKPETIKAIYQVDGDTFKMASSLKGPEGERPTAFDSKTSGIMILRRLKF